VKKKCGVKWESKINKGTQPLINSTCTAFLFVAIVDSGLVMNAVSSIYCDYPATKEKKNNNNTAGREFPLYASADACVSSTSKDVMRIIAIFNRKIFQICPAANFEEVDQDH